MGKNLSKRSSTKWIVTEQHRARLGFLWNKVVTPDVHGLHVEFLLPLSEAVFWGSSAMFCV